MTFKFSKQSLTNLHGVKDELYHVVKDALAITSIDFMVFEGLRTVERQKKLVVSGASNTMNSRHLTGHAVDLVPFVDGPRWDWPLCYKVAHAMQVSARKNDVTLVWGGVWDRELNSLSDDLEDEVAAYVQRKRERKQKAFTDGPHFELCRKRYPA